MSILKTIFARKFCGNCENTEEFRNILSKSSSKITELNNELETFNKLLLFNDTQEHIIHILPQCSQLFVVTILQKLRYDRKIDTLEFKGYFLDNRTCGINTEKPPVAMNCLAVYNNENDRLKSIFIKDFTVNELWQNQGYGSIVMKRFIKFAKYLNVPYVSGELSFVDIGTSDSEDKRENRERLYHFYSKLGFSVDKTKGKIKLDLTKCCR